MSPTDQCPICQHAAIKHDRNESWMSHVPVPYYQCPVCKDFMMPNRAESRWQNNAHGRAYRLSAFVRERHIRQIGVPLLLDTFEGLPEHPDYVFRLDDAL